jgi:hypothetical protein
MATLHGHTDTRYERSTAMVRVRGPVWRTLP